MTCLQDICLLITDGKHGDCQNEDGSSYYFISCKDVRDGKIDYANARQITQQDYIDTDRRTQLEPNDILITNSGTIGRMVLVPDVYETNRTTFQKSVAIVKPNQDEVLPRWLYYYLIANKDDLIAWAGGTAQKNLLLRDLRAFKVRVPPRLTQQKVTSFLSPYDDLMENNTRRIKILEEMAQMIYREWFVHFRFPDHENVKMVESTLGLIPEGWIIVKYTDIADVLSGGTPKTSVPEFWNGDIPFFAPKDAPIHFYVIETEKSITRSGLEHCSSQLYPVDTVFITARGTVGKLVLPAREMAMNQSCYALVGKDELSQVFLYMHTKHLVEILQKQTGGATFDTIIVDTFRRLDVLKPEKAIINEYTKMVMPLFSMVRNLLFVNKTLGTTRDSLLPKLISGELDVEYLDIAVGEET